MIKQRFINNKTKEYDSSFDSNYSDTNERLIEEKEFEINKIKENKVIKESIKNKCKPHLLNNIFEKKIKGDWKNLYSIFLNPSLVKDCVTLKEIELRINSVLNKYDDKNNNFSGDTYFKFSKLLETESIFSKNKTDPNKKNEKFITMIMSKYNEYDLNEEAMKRATISRNKKKINNLNRNTASNDTKASTVQNGGLSVRSNLKRRTNRLLTENVNEKKSVNFKDVLFGGRIMHQKNNSKMNEGKKLGLYSRQNSLKSTNEKAIHHRNLNSETQFEEKNHPLVLEKLKSIKTLNTIHTPDQSFKYDRKSTVVPTSIAKLILDSQFLKNAIKGTFKNEGIADMRHDIKSYEKELIKMNNIFNVPKIKEIKHFLTYDITQEGIRNAKAIRKFHSKDKLDSNKNQINYIISKII